MKNLEELEAEKKSASQKDTVEVILRPYQNSIIKSVKESQGSVLIEAPTGSGKSVVASEIAKNEILKGGKVLIVAPKIILLEQLQETFHKLDPQIIHGKRNYDETHSVFISTLQTAHKHKLGFEPTMIMVDEVHFGFSGKMIAKLLKGFTGRLIGLSATPYDQNSKLIEGFDTHINEFDLKYMLKNKYLVRPKCYAPVKVDLSNIKVQAGDYNQSELDKAFNNFESITQLVENTKGLIENQKSTLTFCINISHANAVATAFNDAGIPTKAIHSKLSKEEQNSIMKEYKSGKVKMLANPMMLTTGFDDPATDCIVLARATKSQNLYRQMVGRGLRLFENKTHAKIIDCAGVVDNLGLPTESQKIDDKPLSKHMTCCSSCKSTDIYKGKDENGNLVRICADCGNSEEVKRQGCECKSCGLVNDSSARFITKNKSLYLECTDCSHHTLISSISRTKELGEVFSENKIKELQEKYAIGYIRHLYYEQRSIDLPFGEDVSRHIRAFLIYISENPSDFVHLKSIDNIRNNYKPFYTSRIDDLEATGSWSWERDGRLFSLEFEAKLFGTNTGDIKQQLNVIQDPVEALKLINRLLSSKGKVTLSEEQTRTLLLQLKMTNMEHAEVMCTKRLKDIYHNNESIGDILKFIPMMESVMN
ncbi:DEAD/DEAH box helicase [Sulfurimonas sp.]|uniref:DEAD/DEAH box helicase n=1 Tax=Sulfurimonas sp. TaxID=2022749 RepID=UPI002633223C|nr:DEAD/DEAH box helicase [Sulfurimonas sp.]MCW8895005.1 DEAD/DEAH box helicase [Sulfurimonas sp.]